MARTVALLVVVLGLLLAADAAGTVKRIQLTTPVVAGSDASLTVKVSPRARCRIQVIYDTVISSAKGLGAKSGGTITWRWRVGSNTHPGSWPVVIDCGKSGKLKTKIRVLAR
jgi:hypothetical protein